MPRLTDTAAALQTLDDRQDDLLARLEQLERRTTQVLAEQAEWLRNQSARIRPRTAALLKSLAIEAPAADGDR